MNLVFIEKHKTFKCFNDSKRLLDRSQYFKMIEGKKLSATIPKSWKKSFNNGVVIPTKMRRCNECKSDLLCETGKNKVSENREFEGNLSLLKREAPNEFGLLLPFYL